MKSMHYYCMFYAFATLVIDKQNYFINMLMFFDALAALRQQNKDMTKYANSTSFLGTVLDDWPGSLLFI